MGMIVVPEDLIAEIEADSEHAEFAASNMLDNHSRKTWTAADGVFSAEIKVKTIGAASDAIMLYYLLGSTATVTVYDDVDLAGSIIAGPTAFDLLETDSYYVNEVQIPGVWMPYASPGAPHSAKVAIVRSGSPPEIGRAFAGKRWTISQNPSWGLGRNPEDHSIVYDLDDGYEYIYPRNTRRTITGELSLRGKPPTEFFTFLHMAEQIGPRPVPIIMASDATPLYRYLIYARIADVRGTEAKYNTSKISFMLKEFL
jgi:hypothetical protein